MNNIRLSLVIPCYNEDRNLPALMQRCSILTNEPGIEVILVNNGSNDSTSCILSELLKDNPNCRSVNVDINQGYGHGIISGLKAAKGDILAWTHADLQTDPIDLLEGLKIFEAQDHVDKTFVKGRRYGRPFGDVVFTIGMSLFETLLLQSRFWDINAQPTMFHRRFFESWINPPDDFSLDLYAYYMACKSGYTVLRFPVRFGERAFGRSHWNINWQSKLKFIKRTVTYSFALKKSFKATRAGSPK